ncbi:MAG: hypothetical protein R2849_17015 [Thermomicrobiales bacterium]
MKKGHRRRVPTGQYVDLSRDDLEDLEDVTDEVAREGSGATGTAAAMATLVAGGEQSRIGKRSRTRPTR